MGFKIDPERPGTFQVWFSKRHPVTRESVGLRRRGITSRAAAQRLEKELVIQVEDRLRAAVIPTWKELVNRYLENMKQRELTNKTVSNYGFCLERHTFPTWESRFIDTISATEIRELIRERMKDKSPHHQRNLLKFIRGAFTYAVESGVLKSNPVPQMHFQIKDKIKKVLTRSEVRTLLHRAQVDCPDWYPVWATALYTGLRSGELFALRWEKINLEARHIVVDTSWNNKDGFKCTKSGHERTVPIASELAHVLREVRLKADGEVFVFPRMKAWEKGEQARELRMYLMGIGLPTIRFHDLRATWATLLLGGGVEPIKVMKMGGWKDMKTMMIYMRLSGIDTQGATESLSLHDPRATGQVVDLKPFQKDASGELWLT